ncbi:MAG: trypsin-like peptidase domain-containing protein [Oscillospiraceae bacterium]|nr:trypsin-like peptidase domain-containing protein [Oscillospiraceae bacterium]
MKKLTALFICITLIFSCLPLSAFAASNSLSFETQLAEDLKALGIFKGVSDTDFALGRAPTRIEALVMLIRSLGKEADALSKGGKHPFLDVPSWADKYVGYAYVNKLTNGMSATKFGSNTAASSSMYLTFVLRALGYSDTNGADFTWDNPFTLARTAGIMLGNPNTINFMRADVVLVSYAALEAEIKGSKQTLAQKLISAGVFSAAEYDKYYDVAAFENIDTTHEMTAEELYEKCSPAVFYIEVYDKNGQATGTGSGFFINSDGTAVTNYHVIDGAYSALIKCADTGRVHKVLGVYDYSEKNDWAVLKIEGDNFPYLEIDESEVIGGSTVYAIGSPKGLDNTISNGLISNTNRVLGGVSFIQISVPISHGSSGGALINKLGKVIGITSAGFDDGQNLNLALPISVIKGYTKGNAHALSAVGAPDLGPLGRLNFGSMTDEQAAFEVLKLFIETYANDEISGYPAYTYTVQDSSGEASYTVVFEEQSEDMYLISSFYANDQTYYLTMMTFDVEYDSAAATYGYYYDIRDSAPTVNGKVYYKKKQYTGTGQVRFGEYDGYIWDQQTHQEMAGQLIGNGMIFLDSIFENYLAGYGFESIESIGFNRLVY